MTELASALGLRPGVTAVIGSGGKTSLLRRLSRELSGTVLLCTTTHIYPFPGVPLLERPDRAALAAAFARNRVLCAGTPEASTGKLTALPYPLSGLANYVLAEADGSRGLPLKAHGPGEPAIPPEAGRVVQVVGLSGLGRPIRQACHRWERFCRLCGAPPEAAVTPELAARVLRAEGLADVIFLNQAEGREAEARALAGCLETPCVSGSLKEGIYTCWF